MVVNHTKCVARNAATPLQLAFFFRQKFDVLRVWAEENDDVVGFSKTVTLQWAWVIVPA